MIGLTKEKYAADLVSSFEILKLRSAVGFLDSLVHVAIPRHAGL